MSTPWIRVPPEPRQALAAGVVAGVVALGAAAVTFYIVRLVLAREPVSGGKGRGGGG